jgi:hypothetical protein
MHSSLVSLRRAAGAIAFIATVAAPAAAQVTTETSGGHSMLAGKSLEITPYAGYMMFGSFIDGPLGTSLSSSAAPLYGAQLGMTLMPGVKLIGNVAHASGDLKVGIPFIGGVSAGTTSALVADGGVELSIPTPNGATSYTPFIQAGVGAMRWGIDLGSTGVNTTSTNLAGNLGAGLDLNFGPALALRLMAKDYIGKFDFKQATSFDISGKTSQNWALTAGLRLAF